MKFIRSTMAVAVLALVAACGDKVTVPAAVTTTVTPKVNSVAVAPSIATMNIGDNITLTAAVNADAGLATTVTWGSSDATKASVDASGKVTAVAATPGVAICATSTVDTGKKGCATVTVNAAPAQNATGVSVTPAAATIAVGGSITLTSVTAGTAGISQAVTWSSADVTKATVTAAGVVTGVAATGGVSICAASTVAGSTAKGCAAIVVTTTPVATANSVTVTPSAVTLQMVAPAGTQPTVQLTASVNLSNSTNTGVTWNSASAAVASVDANGKVTAVGGGSTSVCATSVVTTTVQGCATITVAAYVAPAPASVSIQSITLGGNLNTPVNNAAVAGAINVSLNVSAGGQTVRKVALTVNGVEVDSQTFTSAQAAALRSASDAAAATQTVPTTIVFFVNTAAYNTTTGVVNYPNGAKVIGANLYTTAGGNAAPATTAKNAQNVAFANADAFQITNVSNSATSPAGVVDATGYRWFGNGTLTVNALPVIYSGLTVGTVTASIGAGATAGCAAPAPAAGVNTATANTLTAGAFAVTMTMAGQQSAAGCTTSNPNLINIAAADNNGNAMTLATNGVIGTNTGLRWDNVAPAVPAFTANPNGRTNGWVNDVVSFNTIAAAGNLDGWLTAAVADAGVGGGVAGTGITYTVTTGANGANLNAARFGTGTAATTAAALAPSATNASYCAVVTATDALGNRTAQPATGTACAATTQSTAFGVDRYAPIVTYAAGQTTNTAANAFANPTYTMSVTDTGVVGNSQFGAVAANVAASTTRKISTGVTSAAFATAGGGAYPGVTIDLSAQAIAGYYTTTVSAKDQAGNSTTSTARVALLDAAAPSALVPTQVTVNITPGTATTFNSIVTDAMDIWQSFWTMPYGAVLTIEGAKVAMNAGGFNSTPVNGNQNVSVTVPYFADQLQTVGAGWAIGAVSTDSATFTAAATALTNVRANVMDFNNSQLAGYPFSAQSFAGATGIQGANYVPVNVTASAAWGAAAAALTTNAANTPNVTKLYLASSGDATSLNTLSRLGTTANTATSTTLSVNATGAFGTAAPTFTRIEYYGQCSSTSATNYVLLGTAASTAITSQVDNGAVRTWTFPGISFTPGTNSCGGNRAGVSFIAIMYKADGGALVAPVKLITFVS